MEKSEFDDLEARLKGLPSYFQVNLAARTALRVLPFVIDPNNGELLFDGKKDSQLMNLLGAIFYGFRQVDANLNDTTSLDAIFSVAISADSYLRNQKMSSEVESLCQAAIKMARLSTVVNRTNQFWISSALQSLSDAIKRESYYLVESNEVIVFLMDCIQEDLKNLNYYLNWQYRRLKVNITPERYARHVELCYEKVREIDPEAGKILDELESGMLEQSAEIAEWLKSWNPDKEWLSRSSKNPEIDAQKSFLIDSDVPTNKLSTFQTLAKLTSSTTETVAHKDCLGRENITFALSALLTDRDNDAPFAIGLFGHWGAGKSSQIQFLKEALQQRQTSPRVILVEFNAWYNEKTTNIGAMLAQAVVDKLLEELGFWDRLKIAYRLNAKRNVSYKKALAKDWGIFQTQFTSLIFYLPYIISFLLPVLFLGWLAYHYTENWYGTFSIAFASLVGLAIHIHNFVSKHLTDWFKNINAKAVLGLFKLPDYATYKGLNLEIHRTLQDLCELCLSIGQSAKDGDYLLIVVDDLDRCGVDAVKEVLDAVRLVAQIPRVVTLVAIDERMAFAAVEKHYAQFGHAGRSPALVARDYLAKVLQVSMTLPRGSKDDIDRLVEATMFKDVVKVEEKFSSEIKEGQPIKGVDEQVPQFSTSTAKTDADSDIPATVLIHSELIDQGDNTGGSDLINQDTPKSLPPAQGSLPREKELFKHLAHVFDFSNARLCWRLHLAWKLLKALKFTSYGEQDIEQPMRLLFWQEWLHQQEQAMREAYMRWMTGAETIPEGLSQEMQEEVVTLRTQWKELKADILLVNSVLLPSSLSNTK